jgi:hypothetical protein
MKQLVACCFDVIVDGNIVPDLVDAYTYLLDHSDNKIAFKPLHVSRRGKDGKTIVLPTTSIPDPLAYPQTRLDRINIGGKEYDRRLRVKDAHVHVWYKPLNGKDKEYLEKLLVLRKSGLIWGNSCLIQNPYESNDDVYYVRDIIPSKTPVDNYFKIDLRGCGIVIAPYTGNTFRMLFYKDNKLTSISAPLSTTRDMFDTWSELLIRNRNK